MSSPRVSVRAIVIDDGKILLSRCQDHSGIYHITPGGGVERGETLEEAFARETLEELGVSLPFGEIKFIREVIADRHEHTGLAAGVHQIEINVRSYVPSGARLAPTGADPEQIDLVWHPLEDLDQIRFYPMSLTSEFKRCAWERFYYGEVR